MTPPAGLARSIKDEIPESIGSHDRSPRRMSPWLVAAAAVLLAAGGTLIATLLVEPVDRPVAMVADQQPHPAETRESLASPAAPDAIEPSPEASLEEEVRSFGEGTESVFTTAPSRAPESSQAATQPAHVAAPAPPPVAVAPAAAPIAAAGRSVEGSRQSAGRNIQADRAEASPADATPGAEQETDRSARPPVLAQSKALRERVALEEASSTDPGQSALVLDELSQLIRAGHLPDPDRVSIDAVINHFDYGDRPPWRRGEVSLLIEGGAAPFSPSRWRTIRIGLRSRPGSESSGTGATFTLGFNPKTVALYRRVGESSVHSPDRDPDYTTVVGTIPADHMQSWLFEVKLHPELELDQNVVQAKLRFDRRGAENSVERTLEVGHLAPSWQTTAASLRVAVVSGAWAEWLRDSRSSISTFELAHRAREINSGDERGIAVEELIELIELSVALRNPHRP